MNVRPLADHVVVKPLEAGEQKKGAIIIPDTAEKPHQGHILEVGAGRLNDEGKRVELEVKKGDKVLYRKYTGASEVRINGEDVLIMRESDILAVVG
jgi:chaperonin GroES